MYGYIYKTTNVVNDMVYIGQKKSDHFLGNQYLGSGKLLKKAVKKYGKQNFIVELLDTATDAMQLDAKEIYWIGKFNSTNKLNGYNISEGGFVNRTMVGENNPFYGKHHTQESIEVNRIKHLGKIPWNKGLTKESDERVLKYATSNLNKKSPCKNTIWINNGSKSKMVEASKLQIYFNQGWTKGRLFSKEISRIGINKGKIRITNTQEEKLINPEDLEHYIAQGWVRGRSELMKQKMRRKRKDVKVL